MPVNRIELFISTVISIVLVVIVETNCSHADADDTYYRAADDVGILVVKSLEEPHARQPRVLAHLQNGDYFFREMNVTQFAGYVKVITQQQCYQSKLHKNRDIRNIIFLYWSYSSHFPYFIRVTVSFVYLETVGLPL